jgi:nitrogen fixation/metabolism regulation signal transduction histidine kinase
MKLTLQQLELGLISGDVPKEKTQKSIDIMLKQVEILNEIASSFSAFATMPAPQIKTLDVIDLLQRTIGLFSISTDAIITFDHTLKINIVSDEAILLRAFSNIILNGIQSKWEDIPVEILISCTCRNANCVVSICDNGKGISEELREKVFAPHFTTKNNGAGLGLAIVKQTIELCGGSVWFETEVNIGTTFFIQLPLVIHHN